jgi:hypothetical protein
MVPQRYQIVRVPVLVNWHAVKRDNLQHLRVTTE